MVFINLKLILYLFLAFRSFLLTIFYSGLIHKLINQRINIKVEALPVTANMETFKLSVQYDSLVVPIQSHAISVYFGVAQNGLTILLKTTCILYASVTKISVTFEAKCTIAHQLFLKHMYKHNFVQVKYCSIHNFISLKMKHSIFEIVTIDINSHPKSGSIPLL